MRTRSLDASHGRAGLGYSDKCTVLWSDHHSPEAPQPAGELTGGALGPRIRFLAAHPSATNKFRGGTNAGHPI